MSHRKLRAVVAGSIICGFIAVGAAVSFADEPLSSATAVGKDAHGIGVGLPGVLTLSESSVGSNSAGWSAATVGGISVIGRDSSNAWSGPGGPLGALLDQVNAATCDPAGGPLATSGVSTCVAVLPNLAVGSVFGGNAGGALLDVVAVRADESGLTGASLSVLPSNAGNNTCSASSRGALLSGQLLQGTDVTPLVLGAATASSTCSPAP